jgi:chemotaxis signal transduction protein
MTAKEIIIKYLNDTNQGFIIRDSSKILNIIDKTILEARKELLSEIKNKLKLTTKQYTELMNIK